MASHQEKSISTYLNTYHELPGEELDLLVLQKGWQPKINELDNGINQALGPDPRKTRSAHQGLRGQGRNPCPSTVSADHNADLPEGSRNAHASLDSLLPIHHRGEGSTEPNS